MKYCKIQIIKTDISTRNETHHWILSFSALLKTLVTNVQHTDNEKEAILIDCENPLLNDLIKSLKEEGYTVLIHSFILLPEPIIKA